MTRRADKRDAEFVPLPYSGPVSPSFSTRFSTVPMLPSSTSKRTFGVRRKRYGIDRKFNRGGRKVEALFGRIEMLIKQGTIGRRRENATTPLERLGSKWKSQSSH